MSGTLDQAVAGVEKLVRGPFQPDAAVRAAIGIDVYLAGPAYGEELLAIDFEPAAGGIGQLGTGTKKFHVHPQVLSLMCR